MTVHCFLHTYKLTTAEMKTEAVKNSSRYKQHHHFCYLCKIFKTSLCWFRNTEGKTSNFIKFRM